MSRVAPQLDTMSHALGVPGLQCRLYPARGALLAGQVDMKAAGSFCMDQAGMRPFCNWHGQLLYSKKQHTGQHTGQHAGLHTATKRANTKSAQSYLV